MNRNWCKKTISATLAALMLLPMAACGSDPVGETADTTAAPDLAVTTTIPETESPYDEKGYLKDSLPDDLNFGGEEIHILGWKTSKKDFFSDEVTGDMVSDALYESNSG